MWTLIGRRVGIIFVIIIAWIFIWGHQGCLLPSATYHLRGLWFNERSIEDGWGYIPVDDSYLQKRVDGLRWSGDGPSGISVTINAASRRLRLWWGSSVVFNKPIAVGKPSTPTPLGVWMITGKGAWGGAFGARWNHLSIPWGVYGIHGTNRPGSVGRRASAGCVRMFNRDVIELYRRVPVGTEVVITGSPGVKFGETERELNYSDRGGDIMQLQRVLASQNLYHKNIDGVYGAGTKEAVQRYQEKKSLESSGIVHQDLWRELGLDEFGSDISDLPR